MLYNNIIILGNIVLIKWYFLILDRFSSISSFMDQLYS